MTYLPDPNPNNRWCARCPEFLKAGRRDFCEKCQDEINKATQKRKLVADLGRANSRVFINQ